MTERRPSTPIAHDAESVFRRRYAGHSMAVVGGYPKEDQIAKLRQRLGVSVVWLPTDPRKRLQPTTAIVNRLYNHPVDFVFIFISSISHPTSAVVRDVVKAVNRDHGYRRTVAVSARKFNTEDLASRFLRFAPDEGVAG